MVDAATELANAEGLDAVTMRRVAQALGVVPMTLYTYVPGKAELLDLMLDAAYAGMARADTSGQPWRQRPAVIAAENRALFGAHPWAAASRPSGRPSAPGRWPSTSTSCPRSTVSAWTTSRRRLLAYLLSFVQACAGATASARETERDSAMDDGQWWAANAPLLARVFDEHAYPTAARVGAAAGAAHGSAYNPGHAYHFGLERVLDGLAALIHNRP